MMTTELKIDDLKGYPMRYQLTKLRCRMGLTQQELARRIGCQQSSISAWETGSRIPHMRMIEKIIKFYNLPDNFFIDKGERNGSNLR